jgi:nucleoside-diphosphate-sugar epimerase
MRALITGATGYVGHRLAHRLARWGDQVTAVMRADSRADRLPATVRARVHDGTTAGLARIFDEARPEIVFHLAGDSRASDGPEAIERLVRSNIEFGTALLAAMAGSGCQRLINAGSYWEYDAAGRYCPNSLYAATKHAFQALLPYYVARSGLAAATLVLFDVYGPSDWRGKLVSLLADAAFAARSLDLTPGEQIIDLVHVEDIVSGFLCAAETKAMAGHEVFALPGGERGTIRDLVRRMERIAGRAIPVRWSARPYPPGQIMEPVASLPTLPGWQAAIRLDDGLRECLAAAGGRV